jgi:hypothetical protein
MGNEGEVYADYVKEQLAQEYDRRASLDTRLAAVVSTSGVLTTLLVGLSAFSRGTEAAKSSLGGAVLIAAILGVLAFVVAAVLAIIGSWLIPYVPGPDYASLEKIRTERWADDSATSRNISTWYRAQAIKSLRSGNNRKAALVQKALIAQGVAVAALALAVGLSVVKK